MGCGIPKSKRRESGFDAVDLAGDIYDKVLNICLRMPNRYTYLILQDLLNLAGEVSDYAVKGDTAPLSLRHPYSIENDIRRGHFVQAKCSLMALSRRMNFFLLKPEALRHSINGKEIGITERELNDLSDMMHEEFRLLNSILDSDRRRLAIAREKTEQ